MQEERLKKAANAKKMTEGGRFWTERTKEVMVEKSVKRADVEDVFDVGDLGGRTRESGKAQLA